MKKKQQSKPAAPRKAGYAVILGRPNVGKSTLLNCLIGEKLAGISPKPQTTRERIRGILTEKRGQIVFVDTPGMHDPKDSIGHFMNSEVKKSLEGVDLVYWLVLPEKPHSFDRKILKVVQELQVPVFLLVTQVDRYAKGKLLPVIEHYSKTYQFREIIPVSAVTGDQIGLLLEKTFDHLPEGDPFFPEDQISDQTERFRVAEIIREKVFLATQREIPYSSAVVIDTYDESSETLLKIQATILVERDSQKRIVIGSKASLIRAIGTEARLDLEEMLGKKVFLQLWVKVMEEWKSSPASLRQLGYKE